MRPFHFNSYRDVTWKHPIEVENIIVVVSRSCEWVRGVRKETVHCTNVT